MGENNKMLPIKGPWVKGFAFDIHTIKSERIENDEYDNARFLTQRSEIGQLLYELKYQQNTIAIEKIKKLLFASNSFAEFMQDIEVVIPVPPSNKNRRIQPVQLMAIEISKKFNKEIRLDIVSSTNTEAIKNIDFNDKYAKIKDSIKIDGNLDKGRKILLFDDVYDSGFTLKAIAQSLKENNFLNIYIFAITKTRIPN